MAAGPAAALSTEPRRWLPQNTEGKSPSVPHTSCEPPSLPNCPPAPGWPTLGQASVLSKVPCPGPAPSARRDAMSTRPGHMHAQPPVGDPHRPVPQEPHSLYTLMEPPPLPQRLSLPPRFLLSWHRLCLGNTFSPASAHSVPLPHCKGDYPESYGEAAPTQDPVSLLQAAQAPPLMQGKPPTHCVPLSRPSPQDQGLALLLTPAHPSLVVVAWEAPNPTLMLHHPSLLCLPAPGDDPPKPLT